MNATKPDFGVRVAQNQRSQMPYKPLGLSARDPESGFSKRAIGLGNRYPIGRLTLEPPINHLVIENLERTLLMRLPWLCPVKQKRALLKSNPPRDNWTEGDEINVSSWGGQNLPKTKSGEDYFRAESCLENFDYRGGCSGAVGSKKPKTSLSECPFFRSNPIG